MRNISRPGFTAASILKSSMFGLVGAAVFVTLALPGCILPLVWLGLFEFGINICCWRALLERDGRLGSAAAMYWALLLIEGLCGSR